MLELAEKTVIIAELGKLMVDMLPTDETEPGQPRAYYDGYSRTEELLSEAQRCLQDVVFNPAPITEGFAAQHHGGGGYATDTYRSQLGHGDPSQPGYGDGSGLGGRDQYDEMGGIRPVGGVDPNGGDYGPQTPAAAHYRDEPSYGSYSSPYEQPSHSPAAAADAGASEGSLRHGPGPRLQPLPDFRPISSFQPMGDDATSQWSDARRQPYQPDSAAAPTATPVHDAFASSARTGTTSTTAEVTPASPSTALAPPIADLRSSVDRSSLAYMGSELEPDHDSATPQQYAHEELSHDAAVGSDVEAREAAQAREDAAAAQSQQQHTVGDHSDAYEAATAVSPSVYTRQTHGEGPTPTEEYHPTPLPLAGAESPAAGGQQNPLSPIVEVATPAMTQIASPDPDQEQRDFRASDYAHQAAASQDSSAVVPNSNDQYADQRRRSYTPTAISGAAAAGSYPPSYATGAAASTNAPSDAAVYNGEYSQQQQQPRARQVSAERQSARVASPTPYGAGLPDVPSSPAAATSSFEPRPLGSSRFAPAPVATGGDPYTGQRRPIQIRAQGSDSSGPLGSKYGDIQVGGSPLYAPSSNTSGGNGNNEQKRTLPAGAFRRPPPSQVGGGGGGPASPGIGIGGGRQFSASGYQYDPASQQQQQATPNSSESAAIAQRWRDSSIPTLSAEQQHELEQAGEGELPPISSTTTPSFDVRPLQVNRAQNGNSPRSGSVP